MRGGAPRPAPGQTQAEANRARDEKRVAHAFERGATFVGVKGHKHSPEVLAKKSAAMKRWHATHKKANRARLERMRAAGVFDRANEKRWETWQRDPSLRPWRKNAVRRYEELRKELREAEARQFERVRREAREFRAAKKGILSLLARIHHREAV